MTQSIDVTEDWTSIGTGLTTCVVQARGPIYVYLGASGPGVNAARFNMQPGEINDFSSVVAALGGRCYVRSISSDGASVTYAVA